jgi:hypothetical protein
MNDPRTRRLILAATEAADAASRITQAALRPPGADVQMVLGTVRAQLAKAADAIEEVLKDG